MSVKLRGYQLKAVDDLRNGSILCGGVGSGKTMTSLAYYDKITKSKMPLYVITVAVKRDLKEWMLDAAALGVSPSYFVIDSWANISKYDQVENAFFIFDEQHLVGSGSWVKSFYRIAKHNKWILLSATPGDCWSDYIPVFVANGFYRNKTEFLAKHAVFNPYSRYSQISYYIGCNHLLELKNKILVDMKYYRKTRVEYKDVHVEYDKETFDLVWKKRWNVYEDFPIRDASDRRRVARRVVNSDMSRIQFIKDMLQNWPKMIVFYNYDYELELLKNIDGVVIGERNGHNHDPIPIGDSWLYLVQYASGGEGWNCIETNTVVFYSQPDSYRAMIQAAGRVDRSNTPFECLYYFVLLSDSPVDVSIRKNLADKKDFNELGGREKNIGNNEEEE